VAIGSFIFLRERPSRIMILGISIALIGSIVVSVHDFSLDKNSLIGNVLAIGGAIGVAGYLLAGRRLRAEVDTFRYVTVVYSIAAVLLVIMAIVSNASLTGYSSRTYLLLVVIAMVPQVIGHTTLNWSLKYFTATAVAVIILGEPIGASILALILLGEKLTLIKIGGGLVILTGVIIAIFAEQKNTKK